MILAGKLPYYVCAKTERIYCKFFTKRAARNTTTWDRRTYINSTILFIEETNSRRAFAYDTLSQKYFGRTIIKVNLEIKLG